MGRRKVAVHRGKHMGWWVEGRKANGGLFMMTWWPPAPGHERSRG
jgi:hypothetical protein